MKTLALTVRFLLELAMLAALAVAGWSWGGGGAGGVLLAVVLPLVAIVLWGLFVAPKAARRLGVPARPALEVVLFGAAALGLASAGHAGWAIALAAVYAIDAAAIYGLGIDESQFGR